MIASYRGSAALLAAFRMLKWGYYRGNESASVSWSETDTHIVTEPSIRPSAMVWGRDGNGK